MAQPSGTTRVSRGSRVVRAGVGLVGVLIGAVFLVAFAAGPAVAAGSSAVGVTAARPGDFGWSVGQAVRAAPPATTAPAATTPPGGTTDFNQGNKDADAALAKQKLILAGISAVLLVAVYFGHKAKYKHLWRLRKAQKS